jgi:hypothetical protein
MLIAVIVSLQVPAHSETDANPELSRHRNICRMSIHGVFY